MRMGTKQELYRGRESTKILYLELKGTKKYFRMINGIHHVFLGNFNGSAVFVKTIRPSAIFHTKWTSSAMYNFV